MGQCSIARGTWGGPDSGTLVRMEKDGVRTCDGCGQVIPKMSKLVSKEPDGRELCLACQIREAQIHKGLRH